MIRSSAYIVYLKDGREIRVRATGPEDAFFQAAKKLLIPVSTSEEIYALSRKVTGVYLTT